MLLRPLIGNVERKRRRRRRMARLPMMTVPILSGVIEGGKNGWGDDVWMPLIENLAMRIRERIYDFDDEIQKMLMAKKPCYQLNY